jgi:hypothetical protein
MLMGLVVVGVIGGLAATVLGSHVHREQTDANAVLVSAMERIKSADFDFSNVDCSKTPTVRRDAYETKAREVSLPAGWSPSSITLSSVRFETVAMVAGTANVSFLPATINPDPIPASSNCTSGLRRQLVTLKVTSRDGRAAPVLSFIKGDV